MNRREFLIASIAAPLLLPEIANAFDPTRVIHTKDSGLEEKQNELLREDGGERFIWLTRKESGEQFKEVFFANGKYNFPQIINEAISRTLSRTVLTVLTLFFVILTLYLFGGEIINGFAFTMLIGAIIGAYSSIFIASPFLIWFGYDVAKAKEKEAERLKIKIEKDRMRAQYEKGTM